MDVVQKLLKEKSELYDTIKKNCIVPEVHTGHCQECHETQDEINNYKEETLEIPKPEDDCPCVEQHEENESDNEVTEQQPQTQQNVPIFF